jgi:hypothetical protein
MTAPTQPTVAELRVVSGAFLELGAVDRSWQRLLDRTAPAIDLSVLGHRDELFGWLNSWGCRIRRPRPGEPTPFQDNIAVWWTDWAHRLPAIALAELSDADVEVLGAAYGSLAALPVTFGRMRTLGPTAAAKALYALRPATVMPWDAAIAQLMYGARDHAAFAQHLRLGRDWARAVIAESGTDEPGLLAEVGRPGVSLAKVLDDYFYMRITYAAGS